MFVFWDIVSLFVLKLNPNSSNRIGLLAFLHFANDMMYKAPVAKFGQSWTNIV